MSAVRTRPDGATIAEHWEELVTVALLGTDRRDPPIPTGPLADLVDDTARSAPAERMLAHVAAAVAVRRAGVVPGPPIAPIPPPGPDDRPPCVPVAVDRWHHLTTSWPVLEDEWMLTLIANGWRLAPELVPAALARHRSDPVRHRRTLVAAGPIAGWLIEQLPDLAGSKPKAVVEPDALAELPELPIPPDLVGLVHAPGAEVGRSIGEGLEHGDLGASHRAVLVNVVARMVPAGLADAAAVLDAVDPYSAGAGLATALADLATTRHRMLDELHREL